MPQVEKKSTPATRDEITSAIVAAWPEVFGGKPTLSQVAKVWGMIGVETGGGKYFRNYNVGNINYTSGDYVIDRDTETIGNDVTNRRKIYPKRQAYPNLYEGVKALLVWIKTHKKSISALHNGSPKDFSFALANEGYYDPHVRDLGQNGKPQNSYTALLSNFYTNFAKDYRAGKVQTTPVSRPQQEDNGFLATLERWIGNLFAEAKPMMSKYGAEYPRHKYLIAINSNDKLANIEFARILKLAAKEELDADVEIFANEDNVEAECIIDAKNGQEILNELCYALSDTFEYATKKLGGLKIHTLIIPNQSSKYQTLSIRSEDMCYELFHKQFRNKDGSK